MGRYGTHAVSVVPQTIESYVSVTISRQRYLDFSRFLKPSLNDLVEVLREKAGVDTFRFTKQYVPEQLLETVVRKHVFCADYIDSADRLSERRLPAIVAFYDRIKDQHISEADYEHAERLWGLYGMTTVDDYLRHHLTVQSSRSAKSEKAVIVFYFEALLDVK